LSFSNVIACLALFAALGGSAFAATKIGTKQLKNNAVTSAKIKKNAVTSAKIKNGAVTTVKIKNGAVTGAKVEVSSLGKIPSAAQADSAGTANAAGLASALEGQQSVFVKLSAGESKTLVENGSVSLVVSCVKNDSGYDYIYVHGATKQNGSILAGEDNLSGTDPGDFLNTNTPADDRDFEYTYVSTGETRVERDIDSGFVLGPDGKMISANTEGMAMGLNYLGADCFVAGVFNTLSQ